VSSAADADDDEVEEENDDRVDEASDPGSPDGQEPKAEEEVEPDTPSGEDLPEPDRADADRAAAFRELVQKRKERELSKKYYYSLEFEYVFGYDDDCVFFAYSPPYTLTMLRQFLHEVAKDTTKAPFLRRSVLCKTLGGLDCDHLSISNFEVPRRFKKTVVVSARVHPGEANSSWMCHGLLSLLLSASPEGQLLRDRFVWNVVPALNPDGVVCGNYRCSLAAVDLNRQWAQPHPDLHRPVHELKKRLRALTQGHDVPFYMDLHGHSRKLGIFSYACSPSSYDDPNFYLVRLFPKLLSALSPSFDYRSCRWRAGKGKRGTARVVAAKDLGIPFSYTVEASFFGAKMGSRDEEGTPMVDFFGEKQFVKAGISLGLGVLHFHRLGLEVYHVMRAREKLLALSGCPEPAPPDGWLISPVLRTLDEGWAGMPPVQLPTEATPEVIVAWEKELKEKEDKGDVLGDVWNAAANAHILAVSDDSGGSDSCPSDDNLAENEREVWQEKLLVQERELSLARRRPKSLATRQKTDYLHRWPRAALTCSRQH
jgi:hypothetical protein